MNDKLRALYEEAQQIINSDLNLGEKGQKIEDEIISQLTEDDDAGDFISTIAKELMQSTRGEQR